MNTTNTNNLQFLTTFDTLTTTDTNLFDPFEQYLDLSFTASPTLVNNLPFDFDQWCQSHSTACAPLSVIADKKIESAQLLFQDKPSLSDVFSHLIQADPYDITMHLSLNHTLPPATSQALELPSPSQQLVVPSSSSFSLYENVFGSTWPTCDVSFEEFDMQDLSFLDIPFTTTTVATSTTPIAPLLDFQFQQNHAIPDISGSMNNMDGLSYSIPPPVPTIALSMPPYLFPPQIPQPSTQAVPVPSYSNNSVNPFRSMANISNLFLPQMDTSSSSLPPPIHVTETAPQNLPLLWSVFPSTQSMLPPPPLSSQPALPPLPKADVSTAVVAQPPPVQPVQDMNTYKKDSSPTAFVLDSNMIAKKIASRKRQYAQSVKSAYTATATPFHRSSVSASSPTAGVRLLPYTRSRYPQEPKKRRTSDPREDDEDEASDSNGANCLKLQKTTELGGSTKITPNYLALFDASRRQHTQPLFTPPLALPSYRQTSRLQSPPASPTPTIATSTIPSEQKIKKTKPKGKSGRRPTLKKITDCAHYRPRNAFFMFRGFVSHIHTYLHAKQLPSSLPFDSSVFDSSVFDSSVFDDSSVSSSSSSSCSMTSTRPNNSHNINGNDTDDSRASSPNFPMPHSDTQCQKQRPHLSLSLPPTTPTTTQSPPSPSPTPSPTPPPRRRTRQAQTKVSVSCGKIWSSPCLATCKPRSTGCANCRMRSLFRQASDYLKLRQTEIERLIEFPLLSNEYDGEGGMMMGGGGRGKLLSLEDSFNWKEFEAVYPESDLFKWHRECYAKNDGNDNDDENDGNEDEVTLDVEEMKAIWMENELAYEKAFSEGARKRITQEGLKATIGVANSSCSNKRTAALVVHKE